MTVGLCGKSMLVLRENTQLSSEMAAPFCVPTGGDEGSCCSITSPAFRVSVFWILIGAWLYLVVETVHFNIVLSIVVLRKIGDLPATTLYMHWNRLSSPSLSASMRSECNVNAHLMGFVRIKGDDVNLVNCGLLNRHQSLRVVYQNHWSEDRVLTRIRMQIREFE